MTYPAHIRKTAVWLYTREELSIPDVADRLCVSYYAVRSWLKQHKVLRTRSAGNAISHNKRNPGLQEIHWRAFVLSEQGKSQREIGRMLGLPQSTVSYHIKKVKDFRADQRLAEMEHSIDNGYRRRSAMQREDRFPVSIQSDVLEQLSKRERDVLEARSRGLYLHEIADDLGVTEARICQIEQRAKKRYQQLAA